MLLHISPTSQKPHVFEGAAFVVIALSETGETHLQAYMNDRFDSRYGDMTDERLLQRELPKVLAELRNQVKSSGSA